MRPEGPEMQSVWVSGTQRSSIKPLQALEGRIYRVGEIFPSCNSWNKTAFRLKAISRLQDQKKKRKKQLTLNLNYEIKKVEFPSISNVKHKWNSKKNTNTFESFHRAARVGIISLFWNWSHLTQPHLYKPSCGWHSPRGTFHKFLHPKRDYGGRRRSQRKKHLDVKSNTILTHFEFLRTMLSFSETLLGFW